MASNCNSEDFPDVYRVLGKIAEGSFGNVYRCIKKDTNEEVAVKKINAGRVGEECIKQEIEICLRLNHRNIVKLIDHHVNGCWYFLTFDMAYGGELFKDIISRSYYSELDACHCIEQILKGVAYLHNLNIIHRDIKSRNVLLTDKEKESIVKIADFGSAGDCSPNTFFVFTGEVRSYYMSPEMLSRRFTGQKLDVWGCGVILYIMLVGKPPFKGRGQFLIDQMNKREYSIPGHKNEDPICDDARDLIDKLLNPNPIKRITAKDALMHPFIRSRKTEKSRFHRQHTIDELKKYKEEIRDKWKRAITAVIFKNASGHEEPYELAHEQATSFKDASMVETACASPVQPAAGSADLPHLQGDPRRHYAPRLGLIGRSEAVDLGTEEVADKPIQEVNTLEGGQTDAGQSATDGHPAEVESQSRQGKTDSDITSELDQSDASNASISFLEHIGNVFDSWVLSSLWVVFYPMYLVWCVLSYALRLLRRNIE